MARVTLTGASDDGKHLLVSTDDGEQYTLDVTDELRAAVKHSRTVDQAAPAAGLTPREIQSRIRGGLSAAELAELTGMALEDLARYETPILAERAYISDLARSTRIGRESGAPALNDLVIDRLASRGVDQSEVVWDAWRQGQQPWQVSADYPIDDRRVRGVWSFDHSARSLTAEDDESRWLTETELLDVPVPKRHLASVTKNAPAAPQSGAEVRSISDARPLASVAPAADAPDVSDDRTSELLAELDSKRGTRETVDPEGIEDDGDDFEGFGPRGHVREADVGFTAESAPTVEPEPAAEPEPEAPPTTAEVKRAKGKNGRASVPSWDEIVFGAKSDN